MVHREVSRKLTLSLLFCRNMYTSKCSDAMPAPLQLSCFCRSCIGVRLLQRQQTIDSCSNLAHKPASNTTNNLNRGKNAQSSRSSFSSNRNGNNINSGGELQLQNGDVVCSDAATHLPYHLSAMVCHLGASLSSGNTASLARIQFTRKPVLYNLDKSEDKHLFQSVFYL